MEPTAKHELEVTLAARQELGSKHDDQLIAGGIGGLAGLIAAFIAIAFVFGVAEFRR